MRYHNITTDDMLNGDGLRVVLWVSGCNHACEDCQNPLTWDPNDGLPFDASAREELFEKLNKDYISGLTLSGGDPLYPSNREEVTSLAMEIKKRFPEKTIWLYTGYDYEDVKDLPIFALIDVVVDGPYQKKERDPLLFWRGSGNQRVIDVRKTRKMGAVVLHCI